MAWRWVTTAQAISDRPVKLVALVVTPSNTNSEVVLYDGDNTSSPQIMSAFLAIKVTQCVLLGVGIKTHRGLYVGSLTSITGVLVVWEELEEGE
jgi:hypothetical protein